MTTPADVQPVSRLVTAGHVFSIGSLGSLGATIYLQAVGNTGLSRPMAVFTGVYAVTALVLMLAADVELRAGVKRLVGKVRFHARRIRHPYDRAYLARLRMEAIAIASLPDEWVTDAEREQIVSNAAMDVMDVGGPNATLYALCFLDDVGDARAAILIDRARRAEAQARYTQHFLAAREAVKAAAPVKRTRRTPAKRATAKGAAS